MKKTKPKKKKTAPRKAPADVKPKPSASTEEPGTDNDTEGAQGLGANLSLLVTQINYASENGLFVQDVSKDKQKGILKALLLAEKALDKNHLEEAATQLYEAKGSFDAAWNLAPRDWQTLYERGWWHHLSTFLGILIAGFLLWVAWPGTFLGLTTDKTGTFCNAMFLGLLGAVVRCIYWTTIQANQRTLRRVWATQNVFGPLLGMILGAVIYFLLDTTLVVVTGAKAGTSIGPSVTVVLAFYAGYNWEWALDLIQMLAKRLNPNGNDSKDKS
jgi:hypothetical protein